MTAMDRIYSKVWNISPDLLGLANYQGTFDHVNPAWTAVLGWSAAEITRTPFLELVHPDDVAATLDEFEKVTTEGKTVIRFENRYRHKDGSYRWLSWVGLPEEHTIFCTARDVTEEKANAAQLKSHEEEAQLREQFIAILGHDLRNPLAAIDAAAHVMKLEQQSPKTMRMLDATHGSVARMSRLIDNLTDFARARLGDGMTMNFDTDTLITPLLEQTVGEIQINNPDASISVQADFADPLRCDSTRICQMLSNLVANAITHGNDGHPIRVDALDQGDQFVLRVSNSGAPIKAELEADLFRPFFRADSLGSPSGLGLGLFIAAEIAKGHGGTLTYASDDTTTTFEFRMDRS